MSVLDRRRATALARLATAYAAHLARRVTGRAPRGGTARFAELYAADRITPITPAERDQLPAHGFCIACGLCDFAALRRGHLRPDRMPTQLTRSLPDLWAIRDQPLGEVDWRAGAAVCPMGVPLDGMSGLIAGRIAREGTAAPPPGAARTLRG